MNRRKTAANQSILVMESGCIVFFSYDTPVAAIIGTDKFRTNVDYSPTTNKHLTQLGFEKKFTPTMPPKFFADLVANNRSV
jgi:hypothetical protein